MRALALAVCASLAVGSLGGIANADPDKPTPPEPKATSLPNVTPLTPTTASDPRQVEQVSDEVRKMTERLQSEDLEELSEQWNLQIAMLVPADATPADRFLEELTTSDTLSLRKGWNLIAVYSDGEGSLSGFTKRKRTSGLTFPGVGNALGAIMVSQLGDAVNTVSAVLTSQNPAFPVYPPSVPGLETFLLVFYPADRYIGQIEAVDLSSSRPQAKPKQ